MAGKSKKTQNVQTRQSPPRSRRISPRRGTVMIGNKNDKEASNAKEKSLNAPKEKRQAKKKVLQDLHAEVELFLPGKNHQGQTRRKVTRKESKVRTQKRKCLDRADAAERAERVDGTITEEGSKVLRRKRMRGSKVAFEDEVVLGSFIFDGHNSRTLEKQQSFDEDEIQKDGESCENVEAFVGDGDDELNLNLQGGHFDEENYIESKQDNDGDYGDAPDYNKLNDEDEDEEGRYELYAEELNIDITEEEELQDFEMNLDNKANRRRSIQSDLDPRQSQKIRAATKQFKQNATPAKIARTMYRLSNFKSQRMAQTHGLALGAYARGLNKTSVGTLQEVAGAAPTAPQVYSSLGLVYQNLGEEKRKIHEEALKQWEIERSERERLRMEEHLNQDGMTLSERKSLNEQKEGYDLHDRDRVISQEEELRIQQRDIEARHLGVRIKLTRKTFASYHIAALLCKMDYTLWLRAGDAAMEVANLHSYSLTLSPHFDDVNEVKNKLVVEDQPEFINDNHSNMKQGEERDNIDIADEIDGKSFSNNSPEITTPEEYNRYHTTQKRYWIEQAKEDYHSADLLHPPGISVPAKLAAVHMELGNLSEALTLLTDLKNASFATAAATHSKHDGEADGNVINLSSDEKVYYRERTELEKSYSAWLLYANLMLTIGHECTQWNQGNHSNKNYMFKRWLRKYSESFDWRERRLQVLCLALEAAAGSKACNKIVKWTKLRARQKGEEGALEASTYSGDNIEDRRWAVKDAYELDRKKEVSKSDSKEEDRKEMMKDNSDEMKADDKILGGDCEIKESNSVKNCQEGKSSEKEDKDSNTDEKDGDCEIKDGNMANGKVRKSSEIGDEDSKAISTINALSWHEDVAGPSINYDPTLEDYTPPNHFQHEREALFTRQKMELDKFDLTTDKMKVVQGSHVETKRSNARLAVVQRHRAERLNFIGLHYEQKAQLESSMNGTTSDDKYSEDSAPPLSLSASCITVCQIASQLVKLCLGMGLYHGGRLVSEAVAAYFKERAARHERRKCQSISFKNRLDSKSKKIIQLEKETYDDINADGNVSEDEGNDINGYLSDDEAFECSEGEDIVQKMKQGILPPELQFLYSLCLIGEGGSKYLAGKLFNAIKELEADQHNNMDTDMFPNEDNETSVEIFRRTMVNPMSKSEAFAFTSDLLIKMKKELEWSDTMLPLFEEQFKELEIRGGTELLLTRQPNLSSSLSRKRNTHLKILQATLYMKFHKAQSIIDSISSCQELDGGERGYDNSSKIAISILDIVIHFREALWSTPTSARGLDSTSIQTLRVLVGTFSILADCYEKSECFTIEILKKTVLLKLRTIISWISGKSIPNYCDAHASTQNLNPSSLRYYPISCNWQSLDLEFLSRRAYNLCVSCNVTAFSGWEKKEFTLSAMKRKRGASYFGVRVQGVQVTGHLHRKTELQLSHQWKLVEKLIPTLNCLDFDRGVANAKRADWCVEAMDKLKEPQFQNVPIALYGEDLALSILLIFSKLSLLAAEEENDEVKEGMLIKNSLSILLPVSQFCMDQVLWESKLGKAAIIKEDAVTDWGQHFSETAETSGYKPPSRIHNPKKKTYKAKTRDFESLARARKRASPLTKLIKVPASVLLKEWSGKDVFDEESNDEEVDSRLNKWSETCSGPGKHAMKELDYSVKLLRQCTTISSMQKASLRVAVRLLDVACQKECQNPFLCLNQASVFASQGAKGGNNDDFFKKQLPRKEDCTETDSLSILGRADCLRAIHFTDEAMYLCSFVARVCCLHRDKKKPEHLWTPKWRVVGIQMYTTSVAIDGSLHSLMKDDEARYAALNAWDRSIRAEISRARSDVIAVNRTAGISQGFSISRLSPISSKRKGTKPSTNNDANDGPNTMDDSEQHVDAVNISNGEAIIDSDLEAQDHTLLNSDGDEEFSYVLEDDDSDSDSDSGSNDDNNDSNDDEEGSLDNGENDVENGLSNEITDPALVPFSEIELEAELDAHMQIPDEDYTDADYVAI